MKFLLVSLLKTIQGHSVVVDDENSSKIKRKSYMAIIRKKVQLFGLLTTIIIAMYQCVSHLEIPLSPCRSMSSFSLFSIQGGSKGFSYFYIPINNYEGLNRTHFIDRFWHC